MRHLLKRGYLLYSVKYSVRIFEKVVSYHKILNLSFFIFACKVQLKPRENAL